jgi:hypothetical protein
MKKLIAILLLLVLAASFVSCAKDDGVPDGMVNVAVENAKFYLYVPESWLSQSKGGVSGAICPMGNANVIATAYLPDAYLTPESYWTEKCLQDYTAALNEFAVIEAECTATTLGGINAHKYVFTHKMGEQTYKQMQVIAVDRAMVYTVQYTAPVGEVYDTWLSDADSVVANFTLR